MVYLPPHTVEEKVAALRACLPGVDLYTFLKGMPTVLGRSKETVPRGMSQLREVSESYPSIWSLAVGCFASEKGVMTAELLQLSVHMLKDSCSLLFCFRFRGRCVVCSPVSYVECFWKSCPMSA